MFLTLTRWPDQMSVYFQMISEKKLKGMGWIKKTKQTDFLYSKFWQDNVGSSASRAVEFNGKEKPLNKSASVYIPHTQPAQDWEKRPSANPNLNSCTSWSLLRLSLAEGSNRQCFVMSKTIPVAFEKERAKLQVSSRQVSAS